MDEVEHIHTQGRKRVLSVPQSVCRLSWPCLSSSWSSTTPCLRLNYVRLCSVFMYVCMHVFCKHMYMYVYSYLHMFICT
jgi:hypothetical protein